ncbi:hypothetical protein PoB_000537800 [Plakobranchus ocellatus]|uniref:Uncharacterized protein n=1 Tax=Plakobranchus ocellatus TaxID=259542 RepID=A0AAV3Y8N9_9GAST|nr:hypothetical protein PoB_000537800 [Plakobranchus ocellatus]
MSSSEKYQRNDRSVSPMDDEEHFSTNLASPPRTFIPPAASTPIKLLPTKSIAISPIIEQSMRTKESTTSPLIKFIDTISHTMDKSLSHPLSEHEERLASRCTRHPSVCLVSHNKASHANTIRNPHVEDFRTNH